jgi:trk system potassium uptake protein TrkA
LAKTPDPNSVVVIGLGRFGGQVADSLVRGGHEVLAIDENPKLVVHWSDRLTHVVEADSTDEEALRQLGIAEFGHAVVGIGTDIEASVLTVLALSELKVPLIWAKAISTKPSAPGTASRWSG